MSIRPSRACVFGHRVCTRSGCKHGANAGSAPNGEIELTRRKRFKPRDTFPRFLQGERHRQKLPLSAFDMDPDIILGIESRRSDSDENAPITYDDSFREPG